MGHVAHYVKYVGDSGDEFALVLSGDSHSNDNLNLLVWKGSEGWQEEDDVPHGDGVEGHTWH